MPTTVRTLIEARTRRAGAGAALVVLAAAAAAAAAAAQSTPGAPLAPSAAAARARVTRVDGATIEAESVRCDRGAAAIAVRAPGGREESVPLDEVVAIQFAKPAPKDAAASEASALSLEFTNGDLILASPAGGGPESIEVVSALLGRRTFSIDLLSRLLVPGNLDRRDRPEHFTRAGNEDTAWVEVGRGRGRDVVTGTLEKFDRDRVVVDAGKPLGLVPIPYEDLVALSLVVTETPVKSAPDFQAIVFGADGSRLTGALRAISPEGVDIEWTLGGEFRIPARSVDSIGFKSPKFSYLSDLTPVRVIEYPYVGEARDVLFHWQRDKSVDGNRLSLRDAAYSKGLGVHSHCELVYELGGAYSRFTSDVGVDDEVRAIEARGSVVFRVIVDGTVAWESPVVRGGDPPLRVPPVDLRGKRELRLVVDFADESDAGDRADWAGAFVAR